MFILTVCTLLKNLGLRGRYLSDHMKACVSSGNSTLNWASSLSIPSLALLINSNSPSSCKKKMVGYKIRYIADDVFLFCVYMGGWWEGGS